MKQIVRILWAVIGLYLIALPFGGSLCAEFEVLALSSAILLGSAFGLSVFRGGGRYFSVTMLDVAVLLFLVYEWVHVGILAKYQIDTFFYFERVALGAIYLIGRLADKRSLRFLLFIVAFSGGIQSLVALLQCVGIVVSRNPDFSVTGSFGNPGPLGGYLAMSLVATACLFLKERDRKRKMILCLWGGIDWRHTDQLRFSSGLGGCWGCGSFYYMQERIFFRSG